MSIPKIKEDIEARVQDTGDTITGILHFHNTTGFNSIIKKRIIDNVEWNVGFGAGGSGSVGIELQNVSTSPDTYTSRVDIYSDKITFINEDKNKYELLHTGNYNLYCLPLSGGTLTGVLNLPGDKYYEKNRAFSINMNNSDIVNVNSIYFKDYCDGPTEGIHFWAGTDTFDTIFSQYGTLYFSPQRTIDNNSATSYRIITSAGGIIDGNLDINNMFSTRKETITSGTMAGTRSALIIYGTTYGNTDAHLKVPGRLSWGDPNPQIIFNYSNSSTDGQPLALMYSDNNSIGYGTTLALVSSESTCGFISPYIQATTQFQVIRYDTTPAKNNVMPIFNVKYQNGAGNYYSTDIISLVGTGNTANLNNACIMMGSKSGSLHLHAGECGNSMVSTLGLNDTEHIYMTCDGSILQYVGCANDASSYTLAQTIASSKITAHVPLYGAVWNDYAEYRDQKEEIGPGYCAAAVNDGQLVKTSYRLQACDGIVSDTFGFAIGENEDCRTPLAVSGRVLAYYEGSREDYQAGDAVAAGPNGKVVKMTREEIKEYPDRIVGHVSEIPNYDTWGTGNVAVDGRIWIKVK